MTTSFNLCRLFQRLPGEGKVKSKTKSVNRILLSLIELIYLLRASPHRPLHPSFCVTPASCVAEPGLGGGGGRGQGGGGGGWLSFTNVLDVSHMLQLVSLSLGACDWVCM